MSFLVTETNTVLVAIGKQLRKARKRKFPKDTQVMFARRLGIGRVTYQKMEKGDPSVKLGSYLDAARILDCMDGFKVLFQLSDNLFEEIG